MVEMILAWKMMVFHVTQRRQTPAIYAPRKSLTTMAAVAMSLSLSLVLSGPTNAWLFFPFFIHETQRILFDNCLISLLC